MVLTPRALTLIATGVSIFIVFELLTSLYFVSTIGLAMSVCVLIKFVTDLGRRIEIRDLIAALALTQWIIGPVLAYNVLPYDELYYMAVDEATYMSYVVPACAALLLGLYFPFTDERIINEDDINQIKEFLKDKKYLGFLIAGGGLFAAWAGSFLPPSLRFLFFLLSGMQFVGVYIILLTDSKLKWPAFALVIGMVTLQSVRMGMFGELVLWFMFSILIIAFVYKINLGFKVLILSVGLLVILLIQSIKEEYRMATWYAVSEQSNVEIFQDIVFLRLTNPGMLFETAVLQNMGARLNQGWIIARVLNHMPENQEFVRGETIEDGIFAALVPRILVPDKAMAGGRANFERFTGTELPDTTSMDISLVGEGYANYGKFGGVIFLLVIGIFYNLAIIKTVSLAKKYPTIILWLPIIFFQVIKAETDFATVLNHFTKAVMVTFAVFWGMIKVLKLKM